MLQLDHISKRFGDIEILDNVTFSLQDGDKIGLVGVNGSGKSTLLKIIMGELEPSEGTITRRRDLRISYLPQKPYFPPQTTVLQACFSPFDPLAQLVGSWEEAVALNNSVRMDELLPQMEAQQAWDYERKASEILHKLRITNTSLIVDSLSGGEQKRVSLAGILITQPDVIILDEPTNHLDVEVIEWLEGYLSRNKMTLLLVTHDRYFLDNICTRILEIDHAQVYGYEGNYESFLEKRQQRIENEVVLGEKMKNLYNRELEWIRRRPQARGGKQKARKQAFDSLQSDLQSNIKLHRETTTISPIGSGGYIGNKIIEIENLSKSYNQVPLINCFSYIFSRKDRIGIIGSNGTGKTTFLNLIQGLIPPDKGTIEVGSTVRFGYYAQITPQWDTTKRVIDVVTDIAEHITEAQTGQTITASQLLKRFLFDAKRQYTPLEKLSGGELRRLFLCTVLMGNPNFLILDEPTNDLDIVTLSVLEDYLINFSGCVLIVSHDRFFMDRIVNHLFVFGLEDGKIKDFPGTFTQYREHLKALEQTTGNKPLPDHHSEKKQQTSTRTKPKNKRSYKEEQEYLQLGSDIEAMEKEVTSLEKQMSSGSLNGDELVSFGDRIRLLLSEIEQKTDRWLELGEIGE